MSPPLDQALRDCFREEIGRNFSIVAPAGVGKTASIVDRVIQIALSGENIASEWLPRLVVVTYTNRAADEMRFRARQAILERGLPETIVRHFNRAFFGTIHSFCMLLIRQHGAHAGIPSDCDLITDDTAIWNEFLVGMSGFTSLLPAEVSARFFRHQNLWPVLSLARRMQPVADWELCSETYPRCAIEWLLEYPEKNGKAAKNIKDGKTSIRYWLKHFSDGTDYLPIPHFEGKSEFAKDARAVFRPLQNWLAEHAGYLANQISIRYRDFRVARGAFTYADQVNLACGLLQDPPLRARLRGMDYRVILDEAQDTDPVQFRTLLELTRPVESSVDWFAEPAVGPRAGHFCMVGDPQQSIYGDRADLSFYQKVREMLKAAGGEEVVYQVTFRCDQEIIDFVNCVGPGLLNGRDSQVSYNQLFPRPNVKPGSVQICRLEGCDLPVDDEKNTGGKRKKRSETKLASVEVRQFTAWLAEQTPASLGARSWSDVALLCPRKEWLQMIAVSLIGRGLRVQLQSPNDVHGDSAAFAWCSALLTILSDPRNGFEIAGVLREVYGISDQLLAESSRGRRDFFQIEELVPAKGEKVLEVLNRLAALRREIQSLPLRECVERVLQATSLRARLASLPDPDRLKFDEVLDQLLTAASMAETDGCTLAQWAGELRIRFSEKQQEGTVQADAIQCITVQKAKGLQWDVIIVPFLCRPIRKSAEGYPRLVRRSVLERPAVFLKSGELPEELKEELKLLAKQENQRLLYVALTRARHRLVLVDDSALFDFKGGFAGLMRSDHFLSTRDMPTVEKGPLTNPAPEAIPPASEPHGVGGETKPSEILERARRASISFPRRLLPHTLAGDELQDRISEFSKEPISPMQILQSEQALRYGIWWHGLMERIWRFWEKKGEACWESTWEESLPHSPDPIRAENEKHILENSDFFATWIKPRKFKLRTEVPFLHQSATGDWVEGFVDFFAFDSERKQGIVIDWKTNRINSPDFPALLSAYKPQVEAYRSSLESVLKIPVKAFLYSTPTGLSGQL
jgi:ATP-dependent helicase/nuclease subunit A